MTTIPFTKMVGTGNDFIVVDTLHHPLPSLRGHWRAISRALCDRHEGIGADGLLLLEPSTVGHVRMRIFNPDGSEAEMCGNGARCVAWFVQEWKTRSPAAPTTRRHTKAKERLPDGSVCLETAGGIISAHVHGDQVQMHMPEPKDLKLHFPMEVDGSSFYASYINTGVPHVVVRMEQLKTFNVEQLGRALRHHRLFAPHGANVNFIHATGRRPAQLLVRTYERGVEAETRACGTGVTAAAIIHALDGDLRVGESATHGGDHVRECHIQVETRGGDHMTVSFRVMAEGRTRGVTDVILEGPARRVFEGTVIWPTRGRS